MQVLKGIEKKMVEQEVFLIPMASNLAKSTSSIQRETLPQGIGR